MADDVLVTTLGDLGRGFGKRLRSLSRVGIPGLMIAGPAGMLAQRHLQKHGGARRLLRGGGAGLLMAGPAGFLLQRHLDRRGGRRGVISRRLPTVDAITAPMAGMGDLGRFRFKRILAPVSSLVRPALSLVTNTGVMGKGGGLLAAMGPWGWAAAGALAAGGATAAILARRRKQKKAQQAHAAEAAQAAAAPASPSAEMMPMPMYAPPMETDAAPENAFLPSMMTPYASSGEAMTVDAVPLPAPDGTPSDVIVAGTPMMMEPAVMQAEPMPANDGDAPVMAGLGATPAVDVNLLMLAALGIGAWWLLRAPPRGR